MRFAADALKYLLPRVARVALPQTKAEMALTLLPNVAFAGMTAFGQPEGTSPGLRFLTGVEDLGLGLGLQTLGRLGGAGAGKLIGAARGRPLSPGSMAMATNIGEMSEWLGYGLLPRPAANAAYADYEERMAAQQQQRDERIRLQALREAGAFGGVMPSEMAQAYLGSPLTGGFG